MKHRHFILNKPIGVVSQFVYPHKRKKKLLGDMYDFPDGTMAIGRLDVKSEGLLFLTTDGKLSQEIRSAKVEKEYHILVDGVITQEAIEKLKNGVEIGFDGKKYLTKPCKAHKLKIEPTYSTEGIRKRGLEHGPTSWASITVTEGKYRQIRKMSAAVGFPTLRLIRVRIGGVHLGDMNFGRVTEIEDLCKAVGLS